MLKWYISVSLLCALAQGELNLEKPNFVRTMELNTSRTVTFPFADNIATATTNHTQMHLTILKDDSVIPVTQCTVSLKNSIVGRLKAATIDDAVVIWGETGDTKVGEDKRIRYEGVQVKPGKDCDATPIAIPSYQTPKDFWHLSPVILFNKGSFQVLHFLPQDCPSCQVQVKDDAFVPTQGAAEGKPGSNVLIEIVHLPSGGEGYFYAYNYDNNSAVIRYLDANRAVLKEKYVNHTIDVADPVKNQSLVNVCYDTVEQAFCGQLDDKLEFRFKEALPMLEGHIFRSLAVNSGPKGELLAATLQTKLEKPQQYVVYSYDAEGKMVKAMDFGEFDENMFGLVTSWYDEQSGRYCFHAQESETLGDLDSRDVIKCIDLK